MEIETAMNLIWTPAQLAMFSKVVDLNGFSAARGRSRPKAAVSRAVADLEKTLGCACSSAPRGAFHSPPRAPAVPARKACREETDAARSAIAKLRSPEARRCAW